MKVFPVSTVELAERFTRLTTTNVRVKKDLSAKTARTVSLFIFGCFHICLNSVRLASVNRRQFYLHVAVIALKK